MMPPHQDANWASDSSKRLALLALQASNVSPSKMHMAHSLLAPFSSHLYELAALLKEMQHEAEIRKVPFAVKPMNDMDSQLTAVEKLVEDYSGRCSLYLLMCCPDLLHELKSLYARLKAVLDSFAHDAGWSGSLKLRLSDEKQALQHAAMVKISPKEQSVHDSLEQGVLDSIVTDVTLTTKLARQIADCLGFSSLSSEGFLNEINKLKLEKDSAERRRGTGHAMYLQQFVFLLEKAVAAASRDAGLPNVAQGAQEHNVQPRNGGAPAGRTTLVLPLQAFICPITGDVMKDPVQIASGQTYERSAIERWFAEGHTRCPTGVEVANTNMKSNIALKQSIDEWKERNNTIRLENAADSLQSGSKDQQLQALRDLEALCKEESLYKYRVASKELVPVLVHLAESNDMELRLNAFSVLSVLADNEDCQGIMVKEQVIELAVRCLVRQNHEAIKCVQLMHILSSNPGIAERISHAPSAVLFLVTLIQDEQCAQNVKAILENLPKSDDNVIIMAEANIMEPLIIRLNQGESPSKIFMAKTLGRLHMPDSSKLLAATSETMRTLASMAESAREEEREAAVMALESLSSIAAARQRLQEVGALGTLLRALKGVRHSEAAKRGSAAILANLWMSDDWAMSDTELEEVVKTYFDLLGPPTPVDVQVPMLQGLLGLARSSSDKARMYMKDANAFTCLLRLFRSAVESSAASPLCYPCLELLSCLASSFPDEAAMAVVSESNVIQRLTELVKSDTRREPELLAATSFLAYLPSTHYTITGMMLQEPELLPALIRLVHNHRSEAVAEAAAGALLRFTVPENLSLQTRLAGEGVIDAYVGLLQSGGAVTKERAAMALCNFSKNSWKLSHDEDMPPQNSGCGLLWVFCSAGGKRQLSSLCQVHGGQCSVKGTFCLVQANAVVPLVEILREGGGGAMVMSLSALETLMERGEEEGCAAIESAGGWGPIIGLMGSKIGPVQEKAALLCEMLFGYARYRTQYATQAQMHIITLAQTGTPPLRQVAGRLLHHLDLIHSQSIYFGAASVTTT